MTITTDLAAALSGVQRPGDFCTSGVAGIHPPGLEVEGVGPIALPLLPVQAEALVAVADQAPYGRGDQTILDPTVRRVRLTSRHWPGILDGIVGVPGPVTAELCKLLVYDAGGFFLSHRDTTTLRRGSPHTLVCTKTQASYQRRVRQRHKDLTDLARIEET